MNAPLRDDDGVAAVGSVRCTALSLLIVLSSAGALSPAWAQRPLGDDTAKGQAQAVVPAPEPAPAVSPATPQPSASSTVALPPAATRPASNGRRPPPVWRLEIIAPKPLDELLRNYLDLSRFQSQAQAAGEPDVDDDPPPAGVVVAASTSGAPDTPPSPGVAPASQQTAAAAVPLPAGTTPPDRGLGDAGVISRSELRRLVAAAPEQARSLIEAEGYFASDIKASLSEEVPGQPMVARLEVTPGPKASIKQVQMVFEGTLDDRLSKNDPDAVALVQQLNSEWALPAGAAFRQAQWSAAKNGALATLRSQGYPAAVWSGTAATVDAQAHTARLYVVADSGPAFYYGPMQIEGLERQPASAIVNLRNFNTGDPYRESELLDFQERVQKLNLFESVFVSVDEDPQSAAAAPVSVKVRELPMQQATLGLGVSSDTGPRVSLEHLHRLLWGRPWQAKSKVQLGRDESVLQTDLTSHPRPGGKRWLTSVQFARLLDTDDAVTVSQRLRLGISDEGDRLERTSYVEFQRAKVSSPSGTLLSNSSAVTGNQQYIWRDLDSPVLPTRGLTANVQFGPGYSFSNSDDSGFFGRAYGRLTWYKPLSARWYATVRTEAGTVLASDRVGVPDTLLFRAGGDESVRGYGVRTLGVEKDGVTLGGRALWTGSVEVARPILERFPSLWGAVFLDVGDAAAKWSDLSLRKGYGVGVRWRSPVGPLRLDLAYGHEAEAFRVHFSVGITL